jgi:N utilization substance protein B
MGRRLARELALKILYRYAEGDTHLPKVMQDILTAKKYTTQDKEFSQHLVETTLNKLPDIDAHIVKVLKNWRFDRISVIDKTILRIGTCEIFFFDDIPAQVSINEAIEIAKKFGGRDSGRFINGVLDAIKKNYESSNHR